MVLIFVLIKPNFYIIYDAYARIDRCLGDPHNNWGDDSNRTQIKAHTVCKMFVAPERDDYLAFAHYIIRNGYCWVHNICIMLVAWNFVELISYHQIFSFMRK